MKLAATRVLILLIAVALFAPVAAAQGAKDKAPPKSNSGASSATTDVNKAKLLEATRVSTEEAARKAAKVASKPAADKPEAKENSEESDQKDSAVTELTPAMKTDHDSDEIVRLPTGESPSSPLKKIHGSVYGAGGSHSSRTGASVGASSKSGKTHVYVESERSRSDSETPH